MATPQPIAAALALAARAINRPRSMNATLKTVIEVARDSLPEIDEIGVSLAHSDGRIETQAHTGPIVLQLDELQSDLNEGPCVHAMRSEGVVRVQYAREKEERFPHFLPRAVELGLKSQLGIRLHADHHALGSMNLYSFTSQTISDETENLAELFATHAALALGRVRESDTLNAALESRSVIGQALGMIMERYQIEEKTAFAYLTRVSQTSETKIRDVAQALVEGHLSDRSLDS